MRVVKPLQLGVLSRPFEFNNKYQLCVAGLVLFPFTEPRYPMTEAALWMLVGKELGETVLDECMPKRCGEVLVHGSAYAPRSQPLSVVSVAVDFEGSRLKEIAVVGDRVWNDAVPTEPAPFTSMGLCWENAYGGEGFDRNPTGKGFKPKAGSSLPNQEDPRRLITSMRQTPEPVGLGPYPITWPQRQSKAGTYDKRWLEKFYPGLAQDTDWGFFNVAPPDQQIPGFFRGDEQLVLHNLHPQHPQLTCKLPQVQLRAFIRRKQRNGTEANTEVPMRADTIWLIPHASLGILIFHGTTPIREDDARDVTLLYMACEDMGAPKSLEHYQDVLQRRLSKEEAAEAALDDEPLLPRLRAGLKKPPSPASEMADLVALKHLNLRNQQRRGQRKVQEARELVAAQGLDPDEHAPQPFEPIDPDAPVEELLAALEKAEEEGKRAREKFHEDVLKAEKDTREICERVGIDFNEIEKEWRGPFKGGPPQRQEEQVLRRLRQAVEDGRTAGFDVSEAEGYFTDPLFREQLKQNDVGLMEAYRAGAQDQAAAEVCSEEDSTRLRAELIAAYRRGDSLAGWDLTGANLAGIELEGANLTEALMECCDLSHANLAGAKLGRAVLVRANLASANLKGVDLAGANLSKADCSRTVFNGAHLADTILIDTRFSAASLGGVNLLRAEMSETVFEQCSLQGASLQHTTFDKMELRGTSFANASLEQSVFLNCSLERTDFTGANLEAVALLGCRASRAVFVRANAVNFRTVEGTDLRESDFREAHLLNACLRETDLARSNFTNARAVMADFSESNLTDASLYHLKAKDAYFIRTNLTRANLVGADLFEAILSKANLVGADLSGSNLYQADLSLVRGDHTTKFDDAIRTRARVKPFYTDKIQDIDGVEGSVPTWMPPWASEGEDESTVPSPSNAPSVPAGSSEEPSSKEDALQPVQPAPLEVLPRFASLDDTRKVDLSKFTFPEAPESALETPPVATTEESTASALETPPPVATTEESTASAPLPQPEEEPPVALAPQPPPPPPEPEPPPPPADPQPQAAPFESQPSHIELLPRFASLGETSQVDLRNQAFPDVPRSEPEEPPPEAPAPIQPGPPALAKTREVHLSEHALPPIPEGDDLPPTSSPPSPPEQYPSPPVAPPSSAPLSPLVAQRTQALDLSNLHQPGPGETQPLDLSHLAASGPRETQPLDLSHLTGASGPGGTQPLEPSKMDRLREALEQYNKASEKAPTVPAEVDPKPPSKKK